MTDLKKYHRELTDKHRADLDQYSLIKCPLLADHDQLCVAHRLAGGKQTGTGGVSIHLFHCVDHCHCEHGLFLNPVTGCVKPIIRFIPVLK